MSNQLDVKDLLNKFSFENDARNEPDGRRKGQFQAGWHDAVSDDRAEYSPDTMSRLTWRNLGFRTGQVLGNQSTDIIKDYYIAFVANYYEHNEYRNPGKTGYPNAMMYKEAFASYHKLDDELLSILRVHYQSPSQTITSTKLTELLNFKNHVVVNSKYSNLAKFIIRELDLYIPPGWIKLNSILTAADKSPYEWCLHPQVVEALDELGWFSSTPSEIDDLIADDILPVSVENTSRKSEVWSRIGQGKFRVNLIRYWGECAVTKCSKINILKASHIKPWRDSTDEERLNHFNGLLLTPNLDALFDGGFVSFNNDGGIITSSKLNEADKVMLGINENLGLTKVEDEHLPFLEYHRANIYQQ